MSTVGEFKHLLWMRLEHLIQCQEAWRVKINDRNKELISGMPKGIAANLKEPPVAKIGTI